MHLLMIFSSEHSEHLTYDNQEPSLGDGFYASDALGAHAAPDTSNVAVVIIETDITRLFNLVPVILHFATVLGPTWSIVLVTLEANWNPLNLPASRRFMKADRLRVMFLHQRRPWQITTQCLCSWLRLEFGSNSISIIGCCCSRQTLF